MRKASSVPALGALAVQPLSWHQGTVHCEQLNNSAPVTRWAGRLRRYSGQQSPQGDSKVLADISRTSSKDDIFLPTAASILSPTRQSPIRESSPDALRDQSPRSPPDMRRGVSEVVLAENARAEDRGKFVVQHGSTRAKKRGQSAGRREVSQSDHLQLEQGMKSLSKSIADIKHRHETFQPLTAQQRARAELFKRSSVLEGGQDLTSRARPEDDGEDLAAKIDAWKYARTIEPELPPLVPMPRQFKKIIPDQQLVQFNASSEALERCSPEARRDLLAYRESDRAVHRSVVAAMHQKRRADLLAKRREDSFKTSGGKSSSSDPADQLSSAAAQQWITFITSVKLAGHFHEVLQIRKMDPESCQLYLTRHVERLKRSRSNFVRSALRMNNIFSDSERVQKVQNLSLILGRFLHTWKSRKRARVICSSLQAWATQGRLMLALRAYALKVKRLQRFWRTSSKWLRQARDKMSRRWLSVERSLLTKELKDAELTERPGDKHYHLSMEDRIQLFLISESDRLIFLEHELRARRYKLLPKIDIWEEEVIAWHRDLAEWEDMRKACIALGHGIEALDQPVFRFPPVRPSYMPQAEEIIDMIMRARKHAGQGWEEIPKKNPGLVDESQASRKRAVDTEPKVGPFGAVDQKDLERFGVDKVEFPDPYLDW